MIQLIGLLALLIPSLAARKRRRRIPAKIKYRGKQRRSWYKEPNNPNRIGHGSRGVPYAVANSFAGLWFMVVVLGKKAADRDLRMTQDREIVVVHWTRSYEGWKGRRVELGVEHSPWSIVKTWEAMGKYRIHTIWQDIDYIADHKWKTTLYIEPKANYFILGNFVDIKKYADERGVKVRGYSYYRHQVALMNQAGIHATQLRPAK